MRKTVDIAFRKKRISIRLVKKAESKKGAEPDTFAPFTLDLYS